MVAELIIFVLSFVVSSPIFSRVAVHLQPIGKCKRQKKTWHSDRQYVPCSHVEVNHLNEILKNIGVNSQRLIYFYVN